MSSHYANHYLAGRPLGALNGPQARELAEYLVRKHSNVYTDARHPDNAMLSADVRSLHERAAADIRVEDRPL